MIGKTDAYFAMRLAAINGEVGLRHARAGAVRARQSLSRRNGHARPRAPKAPYDPLDTRISADPHPVYRQMLAGPPLHYSRRRAIWIISHHEHVHAAGRAHDVLSSAESITRYRTRIPMMITIDRPEHTRMRKLVVKEFTRDAMERHRPEIERLVDEAMADVLADPVETDGVKKLAFPLPVAVIAHLLGIPARDLPRFRAWSDHIVKGFAIGPGSKPIRSSANILGSVIQLYTYMHGEFERLRKDPGDDVLSGLIASSVEGNLSPEELYWFSLMLLLAGNETTTNLLGTMLLSFAQNPEQYQRLRAEPELIPSTVEEALRHGSPIQGLYRTATREYQVGDATIPANGRVLLLFGAANRDPRKYPDPDRFDIARNPTDHLAFGTGIHFCLGSHLARLETSIVLRELIERVERIELAGEPRWNNNPSVRGLTRLPLRLTPAY